MRLWATLDRRFWIAAAGGTLLTMLVLGVPTAVIPNPFFVRMIPTDPVNVAVLAITAPLMGALLATYLSRGREEGDVHADGGGGRASVAGIAAYLAIGCPICNKVIVAVLGVSGALNVFAPLQPIIGAASVALLGATLIWRLRMRARGCTRCATAPGPASFATPAS